MGNKKIQIWAFYLPQFHPIKENDEWWGKGYTEWTNVGKAKKYYKTHQQPKVPADLGYYDLRVPEIRREQAELATFYGIDGFLYWHYWFGNHKQLLDMPFKAALQDKLYHTTFALAWANESWQKKLNGNTKTLIEQFYPSTQDHIEHFNSLLPAFQDDRYIKIDNKPVFLIYKPNDIPNITAFIQLWNTLAQKHGFAGMYFIAHHTTKKDFNEEPYEETVVRMSTLGFNAINFMRLKGFIENRGSFIKRYFDFIRKMTSNPLIYPYEQASKFFSDPVDLSSNVIPTIISGWDNTPRHANGIVLSNYTPSKFEKHVNDVFSIVKQKNVQNRIIILKSWNEWAEGNYIEPDLQWGLAFLEIIKQYAFNTLI